MGFEKNIFICAKMYKHFQHAIDITTFGTSRVQFTIAVRPGSAFTEAVITIFINNSFFIKSGKIPASFTHIFPSFKDDGFYTQLDQLQR